MYVNSVLAVKQLDIYDKVGKGIAHDEYIPFTINKGQILVETQLTRFPGNLHVEFVKVRLFFMLYAERQLIFIVALDK